MYLWCVKCRRTIHKMCVRKMSIITRVVHPQLTLNRGWIFGNRDEPLRYKDIKLTTDLFNQSLTIYGNIQNGNRVNNHTSTSSSAGVNGLMNCMTWKDGLKKTSHSQLLTIANWVCNIMHWVTWHQRSGMSLRVGASVSLVWYWKHWSSVTALLWSYIMTSRAGLIWSSTWIMVYTYLRWKVIRATLIVMSMLGCECMK